ncbi:hypothetical protein FIBSPDRAFT_1045266, partial [Athelia psychrophila]
MATSQDMSHLRTSDHHLAESLKHSQLQSEALTAQNIALQKEHGEMQAKLLALKAAGGKTQITLTYQPAVRLLGKKFSVVHSPWIEKHVFDKEPLPDGADRLDPFKDEASYERYLSGVLQLYVPTKYHDDMRNGTELRELRVFADVVIAGREEEEEEEEDNLSGATPRLDTFEAELVAKFGGEFFLDDEGHSIANPADSGGDFDPQLGEFEITDEESGESNGPPADYPFAMNPADSGEDFGPQLAEIDGEEFSESDDSQADDHFTTAYYQRNRVPTADPRPIPPPRNHIQGLSQTAPVNSTAPSHSTLVHPDAQVAGITTALRSAEADRAWPRGPPAIIATQPRVPAASAVAAQPTQPAVRVKPKSTRGAADRALSPDNSNPIQVLSTVLEEETLTSTRKTRSLSKTTTTTKKVANPRQKKAAAPDPGPSRLILSSWTSALPLLEGNTGDQEIEDREIILVIDTTDIVTAPLQVPLATFHPL